MNEEINKKINRLKEIKGNYNLMEVCGTHTVAISKTGLRNILPSNINLISGPGCPVCVTPDIYIDYVYELSLQKDIIIATYGDMIRVPGSNKSISLEKAKALGADVRMVISSMDALSIARENPLKKVVFIGIGFETTVPHSAVAVKLALSEGIKNFYLLSVHKIVEPVMRLLLEDRDIKIDGFLCPGHVAAIIGEKGFNFLKEYNCTGVVAGFGGEEIMDAILTLITNIHDHNYDVCNDYKTVVRYEGNPIAMELIQEVFKAKGDYWRGIGYIEGSSLKLKDIYSDFDIEKLYPVDKESKSNNSGCCCGDVLKGKITPDKCKLFGKVCDPFNPVGPCMVSSEGSCAAYFKYKGWD